MMVYFRLLRVQFQARKAFSQEARRLGKQFADQCSATVVGYIHLDLKP